MYARSTRRRALSLPKLSHANFVDPLHPDDARLTCPYCKKRLDSEAGRNRRIALRMYCRAQHEYAISTKEHKQKRSYEEDIPISKPPESEPPTKRLRPEEDEGPPVAGPSRLPEPNCTVPNSASGRADWADRNKRTSSKSCVEEYPIKTAGASIGVRSMSEQDLQAYMESCGALRDLELFETAEIMMTTGLSGRGRNRHLKAPACLPVQKYKRWKGKGKAVWNDSAALLSDIDKLPSGPGWTTGEDLIRNKNGTIVPLIIASNETSLTNNPRGPKGYPVYLSIGNISKSVRRRPTKRAMLIIGYLPVDSFGDVPSKKLRTRYRGELLHRSLAKIFEPLKTASSDGILAQCADGYIRHIYPIIGAWVADFPEQSDVACTNRGGCPKCKQKWRGRGQGGPKAPPRDHDANLKAFQIYQQNQKLRALTSRGLKPWPPFWADIPHANIGSGFTPDLLHQLYKGMFEHARDWVENMLGTNEFNRRFIAMPQAQDLRWFKKGVTKVKLWAGRESRDMMRQFLPVVIDAQVPRDFIQLMRALLDFSYLAHGAQLTDADLAEMDRALRLFHIAKRVLVKEKIVKGYGSFNQIVKLHMLGHYTDDIRELGTPDGYSTETPEHLHIIYIKVPWRASNRRDPIPQMVKHVQRLEALYIHRTLLDEYYGERPGADEEEERKYRDIDCEEDGTEDVTAESEALDVDNELEDGDNGDNGEDGEVERVETEPADKSEIHYPRPDITIAKQPTAPRVPGQVLITSYGASDLVRALNAFLASNSHPHDSPLFVLPSDRFDVWHKATLTHLPMPFVPGEACHCDILCVHPAVRDSHGHIKELGVFDTALFAYNRNGSGLSRFRAGRVRAIFTLPKNLKHVYTNPLVYLDIFSPFVPDDTASHGLFRATPGYFRGTFASLVLPLRLLVMACHLAPDFSLPLTPVPPSTSSHVVYADQPFYFNEFYNHFTFLSMTHWRRSGLA
ncbi:hypothetical protein FRC07_004554 [Ceratobasidium sp. 392]|nr:hypothetical protein FRC07_004554 [Ceratobasidium sp. 392]